MGERKLHFTAPGFKPQVFDIAPDAETAESKRYDLIKNEDNNLTANLGVLEEGTKARNRENLRRLEEVWSQTSGWEAKIIIEKKEAEESIKVLQDEYEVHINKFEKEFLADVERIFAEIDGPMINAQIERVVEQEKDVQHFVDVTVPDKFEIQSGEVSRQLKKQYETFDIEKQKGKKKEKKFIAKASEHIEITAQKFADEDSLLKACFFNLEEDIIEYERRASRMHLRRYDQAIKEIKELEKAIQDIAIIRKKEDSEILDITMETQLLLQKTILEHFGAETEGNDPIDFKKLNNRMKRKDKGTTSGGESVASSRPGSRSSLPDSAKSSRPHSRKG